MTEKVVTRFLTERLVDTALQFGSLQQFIFGILLLLNQFGVIFIPENYLEWFIIWISFNLLASPIPIRRRLITPKVVTPKCNYCGSNMTAIKLRCENPNCRSVSELPKES